MAKSKRQQEIQMYGLLAAMLAFFGTTLFVVFWITRPEAIMRAYVVARQIEFATFWDQLFPQARRLIYEVGAGYYQLTSIVKSSLPTAVVCGIGIGTVGALAYQRVSSEHLDAFITHKEPPTMRTILGRFALIKPSVRFVLDYSRYPLSAARGAGRLPYSPLDFLHCHGLIRRIGKPAEWEDPDLNVDYPEPLPFPFLDVDDDRVREALAGKFGARNPFLALSGLTDPNAIREAVDQVPWYMVVVLAPALARIHHSIFFQERAYVASVLDLHKFPDRVWNDLAKLKKIEGDRLRLGFDDDKHRASENSLWHERRAQGQKRKKQAQAPDLVTLAEYLAEPVVQDGKTFVRAETLPSVREARQLLWDTLTQHLMADRKAYPVGEDDKGRFVWKDRPPTTAAEKAYLDRVYERLMQAADECAAVVKANAYCFGLLGAAVERTRRMGVFHPAPWRWMRFIDIFHWRFFLDLGKPISSVDALGMWEHFNAERAIGSPICEPFLRRSPNDLKRQAARFVTRDFVRQFNAMNAVEAAGDSITIDGLFAQTSDMGEGRTAEEAMRERMHVDLTDFDPSSIFAAADKPLTLKSTGKRIVH